MANVHMDVRTSGDERSSEALFKERDKLAEMIEQARHEVGLFDLLKLAEMTTSAQRELNLMTVGTDSYSMASTGSYMVR